MPSAATSPSPVSPVCTKCGTFRKSGKRSCCARGGTWYENCGDDGDTDFDHTWTEGKTACKSKCSANIYALMSDTCLCILLNFFHVVCTRPGMTQSLATTTVSSECTKCGTFKESGKRSCCARGGTWYLNCGDPGDSDFDHTWGEGIAACISKFTVGPI